MSNAIEAERETRRYVAKHALEHVDGSSGCMICVALRWSPESESVSPFPHEILVSMAKEISLVEEK